jgi:ParB family transcriptional regulator, chromosome partitioning protein
MSVKKPKLQNNPLSWVETKKVEIQGIRLSDVQYISPSRLKPNPLNTDYFREESNEYFNQLREDIEKRGIIVPLIAKKDDTLLAGHNRLRLAKDLGIENIPVQYVLDTLPLASEREFIIKDNLYRRQFSSAEWIGLYKKLYPNFDEEIHQETRGGGMKWSKTEHSVLLEDSRLTADKIARDTGQKVSAVQKQLSKYRKEVTAPKAGEEITQKILQKGKFARAVSLNTEIVAEANMLLKQVEDSVKKEGEKTIRQVLKKIDSLKTKLERLVEG